MIDFSTVFEIITFICIFYYILGCSFYKKKNGTFASILLAVVWIIFTSFLSYTIPNTFIIFFIILLLFDCKPGLKITWTIISTTILLSLFYLLYNSALVFSYTFYPEFTNSINMEILEYIIYFLTIILCILFQKRRQERLNTIKNICSKTNLLLSLVCICGFILINVLELVFTGHFTKRVLYVLVVFSLLLIVLTAITTILVFKLQHKNNLLKQLFQTNQEMLSLEKKQYKLLQDKNQSLRSFRHDFNGHILALQTYIKQNEIDKLYSYINSLSMLQSDFKIYSTNNIIVDAIINQVGENLSSNIIFKVSGQFREPCFIDDFDLCTLFTNLLNNSVEAIDKLDSTSKKEIYIEIEATISEIKIRALNTSTPYSRQELDNLTTTKKDSLNHGFGLFNIQQVVKKYRGDLFFDYEKGFFLTYISCKDIQ